MWGTRSEQEEGCNLLLTKWFFFYQSIFAKHVTKIRDNEDTIEEDVRETNVRKFLEVTDTDLWILWKKLRFRFIDEAILNEKTCNVTCTEHKRGLKSIAHKIIFLSISPFLRNMWQKSVLDFSHEISHEGQSRVKKRKL